MGGVQGYVLCEDCSGKIKEMEMLVQKCDVCGTEWKLCEPCYESKDLLKIHEENHHKCQGKCQGKCRDKTHTIEYSSC